MKLKVSIFFSAIVFLFAAGASSHGGTLWDNGGSGNNINTPENWDGDTLPAFDGTATVTFGTAGNQANINTNVAFEGMVLNRETGAAGIQFTIAAGAGNLSIGSEGITADNTLGGRIYAVSTGLTLAADQEWSVTGHANTTLRLNGGAITDGDNTFGITKTGAGALQLQNTAPNTYDGVTHINEGTLSVTVNQTTLGSTVGNTVVQQTASLQLANMTSSSHAVDEEIVFQGSGTTPQTNGNIRFHGSTINPATTSITQNGDVLLDGTGNYNFIAANQTATLAGDVRRTGSNSGTLTLTMINDSSDFDRSVTFNNAIANNGGNLVINGRSGTNEATQSTVLLAAADNNLGNVSLDSNENRRVTLQIGADNALSTTHNLTITRGILDLAGNSQTLAGLSGAAGSGTTGPTALITNSVADTTSTLTLGNGNVSATMGGVIQDGAGTVGITKVGTGTQTFSGMNTYTGATHINAGTLLISAAGSISSSSLISVAQDATLNVTAAGLMIEAGNAIGGLGLVLGDLTLDDGANFVFNLNGPLVVEGDVSLANSFGVGNLLVDWTQVQVGVYALMDNDSDFSNIQNWGFENRATGLAGGLEAYFQAGSLELVVIPEPSTGILLLPVGLAALAWLRRRRSV